jgi:hypothetical protein
VIVKILEDYLVKKDNYDFIYAKAEDNLTEEFRFEIELLARKIIKKAIDMKLYGFDAVEIARTVISRTITFQVEDDFIVE